MDTVDEAMRAYSASPQHISVYYYDTINKTKI